MSTKKHTSFEKVYPQISIPLSKFIAKKIGSNQEAVEEVFSRTIIAAWKGWNTFKHKSTYLTWICAISIRKIADYYREQISQNSSFVTPFLENFANDLQDKNYSPEELVSLHELRVSIRQCLKLVPEEKRELLYLRYWKDLTIKEIAKISGLSHRSIEGKLYRARKEFRKVFYVKFPELVNYTKA